MIEKPPKGRAIISQDFNSLNIEIPSKKNWFIIIFMMVWMVGWVMGETFAVVEIFHSDTPLFANAFLLFWLVGWTVGGAFVLYTISWQLIGRETINIQRGILNVGKSVIGIGRKKRYDIQSIKNLDINPIHDLGIWGDNFKRNMFAMKGGKIKFDYGMKIIKFANDIDEAEARMIIEKLKINPYLREDNFA